MILVTLGFLTNLMASFGVTSGYLLHTKSCFPHVEDNTENRGVEWYMGKKKITGPKENAISFKICRAKKSEIHERLERKLRPVS